MYEVEAIFKSVQFAEKHLKSETGIADMANACHYSLYHFCRLFNLITRHTPYDYLVRRRLSESVHDLLHTDRKIIEIAFDYQFNSPETYIRAFKRMFGIAPGACRKLTGIVSPMPPFSLPYLEYINQGAFKNPGPVFTKPLTLCGVMAVTRGNIGEHITELEQCLRNYTNISTQSLLGIRYQNPAGNPEYYFLGYPAEKPPAGSPLAIKSVPGGAFTCFSSGNQNRDCEFLYQYINHTWRPLARPAITSFLELYGNNSVRHIIV